MRIVAFNFPSSIFAETALASIVAASCFLALYLWVTVSLSALNGSIVLFLIMDVRLCRLPLSAVEWAHRARNSADIPRREDCLDRQCTASEVQHIFRRMPVWLILECVWLFAWLALGVWTQLSLLLLSMQKPMHHTGGWQVW